MDKINGYCYRDGFEIGPGYYEEIETARAKKGKDSQEATSTETPKDNTNAKTITDETWSELRALIAGGC